MNKEQASKKTILLVEDDIFIGDIFETKISISGFNVVKADNGKQAIEKLEEGLKPNLMLLDLRMPEMDGFTVLEKLNEKEEWKEIPVVVLTNFSGEDDIDRCMKMGAKDYLVKSFFTPAEVMEKVEKYIS
ncbi:MAG: response regulator [Candidatus Moranbacteria bacterium]|nr:response regulator [Candidatus Moranbacteria bacterium]